MVQKRKSISIIGGGITGLATAWFLEQEGYSDITLIEASARLGGKIKTERHGNFLVETGPDAIMSTKPGIMDFIRDLGIEDQLIEPNSRHFYVLHKRQLKPVPAGFASMVPADMSDFRKTSLLSWRGKLRLLMERFVKARDPEKDESLAHFVKRRFGKEVLDKMAEPLFTGVYSAPANQLSIKATFPHFKQMEAKHGSITKAVLANRKKHGLPKGSPFRSFQKGMQTLPDTIESQLKYTKKFYQTSVNHIKQKEGLYQVQTHNNSTIPADDLVLTIPAYKAGSLLEGLIPNLAENFGQISYATSVIATLAFERKAIRNSLDATGFLIPSSEQTKLSACTWSSEKWKGRAPENMATFRCFFSNVDKKELKEKSKAEWIQTAQAELKSIMAIDGEPYKSWLHTWEDAQPQYKMGHLKTLRVIEGQLAYYPGLHLAGSPYRGVGIPDCVKQAWETAMDIQGNG